MEPTTESTITKKSILSVRYYQCGYCSNRLGFAYKGESFKKVKFPSGVFLIHHAKYGYMLFDTGYSESIMKSGCAGWMYRHLNPVHIDKKSDIRSQLLRDGITTDEIKYVALSHLHPDHIGGVSYFPNSTFLLSKKMLDNYHYHKTSDLILDKLFPDWFESRIKIIDDGSFEQKEILGLMGYDIFKDDSISLVELDGHASGHLGALIDDKVILAGDSCWSNELVNKSNAMRFVMNLVNHNQCEFKETSENLKRLRENGIRLCFSHENYLDSEIIYG